MSSTQTHTSTTRHATSADGTRIAFETRGSGPVVVLVDGALCSRTVGTSRAFAELLAQNFTAVCYDRRGRGASEPGTPPWSVEKEAEDIVAVLAAVAGPEGTGDLVAFSSGVPLALTAAQRGAPVRRMVCYEAPFVLDDTYPPMERGFAAAVQRMVDDGRRADAVDAFMKRVGVPAPFRVLMRVMPAWTKLKAVAHTLPYDLSMVEPLNQGTPIPEGSYAGAGQPTLVVSGGKSPGYMRSGAEALAAALPRGTAVVLPGQTHMVKPKALVPLLVEHLG